MSIIRRLTYLLVIMILVLQVTITSLYAYASSVTSASTSTTLGPQSTIVILVEFDNLKHQKNKEILSTMILNDLNNYVTESSYNASWIIGNITDWVKLPAESSYYGRDFGTFIDAECRSLIADSIRAVDPLINFNLYKHIIIVHAGKGQETTGALSDIWSGFLTCRPPVYADGRILTNAIIIPESEAREIDPLGIYAHEFMHSLGLPDLYPDINLKKSKHVGVWDIMDTGMRNGEPKGSSPAHPTSWSKMTLNWPVKTKFIYAGSFENVTISPLEKNTNDIRAVILPITSERYYVIEVRLQLGFDKFLPSKGVIIIDVNERRMPTCGMVRIIDADPTTPDLKNATFKVGQSYNDPSRLVRISIINENEGFTLQIDRRID